MYAPWKCKALVSERSALERARDARAGRMSDPAVHKRFQSALDTLTSHEKAHRAATGCTDNH